MILLFYLLLIGLCTETVTLEYKNARCDNTKGKPGGRMVASYTNQTEDECEARCAMSPYCMASFVTESKKCMLFRYCDIVPAENNTTSIRFKTDFNFSNPVHVYPESKCQEPRMGFKYTPKFVTKFMEKSVSLQQCADFCRLNPSCEAFSYYPRFNDRFQSGCDIYAACTPMEASDQLRTTFTRTTSIPMPSPTPEPTFDPNYHN